MTDALFIYGGKRKKRKVGETLKNTNRVNDFAVAPWAGKNRRGSSWDRCFTEGKRNKKGPIKLKKELRQIRVNTKETKEIR